MPTSSSFLFWNLLFFMNYLLEFVLLFISMQGPTQGNPRNQINLDLFRLKQKVRILVLASSCISEQCLSVFYRWSVVPKAWTVLYNSYSLWIMHYLHIGNNNPDFSMPNIYIFFYCGHCLANYLRLPGIIYGTVRQRSIDECLFPSFNQICASKQLHLFSEIWWIPRHLGLSHTLLFHVCWPLWDSHQPDACQLAFCGFCRLPPRCLLSGCLPNIFLNETTDLSQMVSKLLS